MHCRYFILASCLCLPMACDDNTAPPSEPTVAETVPQAKIQKKIIPKSSLLNQEDIVIDYEAMYTTNPPEDKRWITFGNFKMPRPAPWFWVPPKSKTVTCNYVLPGVKDKEQATFSIIEFDIGEGGEFEDNLHRWRNQFRTHEGAPVTPRLTELTVNGKPAKSVMFRGEYMGSGAAWHLSDYTLQIIVINEATKNIFFKLLGPTETIEGHQEALQTLLQKIELLVPTI